MPTNYVILLLTLPQPPVSLPHNNPKIDILSFVPISSDSAQKSVGLIPCRKNSRIDPSILARFSWEKGKNTEYSHNIPPKGTVFPFRQNQFHKHNISKSINFLKGVTEAMGMWLLLGC